MIARAIRLLLASGFLAAVAHVGPVAERAAFGITRVEDLPISPVNPRARKTRVSGKGGPIVSLTRALMLDGFSSPFSRTRIPAISSSAFWRLSSISLPMSSSAAAGVSWLVFMRMI
jgi:hypothetical protein